jgi:tetratricopeptide (TPR) repeat protein
MARTLSENDEFWAKTLALAQRLGDHQSQVQILFDWSNYLYFVGDFRGAFAIADRCSATAETSGYGHLRIVGDLTAGTALLSLGDQAMAARRVDPSLNRPLPPDQRSLFGYRVLAWHVYAIALWLQGYPERSIGCIRTGLDEAQMTGNALIISNLLCVGSCPIALYVGDLVEANRSVAMLLDYSSKHGLSALNAAGRCLKGTLLLAQGDLAGLAILRAALGWFRETGFALHYTISVGRLAEGLVAAGQVTEAHIAIDEALGRCDRTGERWCLPELLRIKGDVLRLDGADETAEGYFQQALDRARRQGALSWELRAAMSLAKLWHQNGKTAEAHDQLAAVYDRFTEGFDTADLKTARALMSELRGWSPQT